MRTIRQRSRSCTRKPPSSFGRRPGTDRRRACPSAPTLPSSLYWEFYPIYYKIAALKPIQRQEHVDFTGHDFYVLTGPETGTTEAARLKILFSDPVSGVVLAR